jgi:hypothetical protein
MFRFNRFRLSVLLAAFLVMLAPVHWYGGISSANLASVSVTMSNPRLSYSAILDANNVVSSNLVSINTTAGAAPSTSTANLFEGEAVTIGGGSYTVASVSALGNFTTTSGLGAGNADTADQVISNRRPAISVGFQTVTAMEQNWDFRVLIPSGTTDPDNSIPDIDGWDYGSSTATDVDVTCPTGNTYTITRGIADVTIAGVTYHSFTCNLDDATVIAAGANYTSNPIIIGDAADPLDSLINPAPNATHINGYSDSYPIIVQQLDASGVVMDQTVAAVAVVDAVRITASVPPQISFRILGVASGASRCGVTTTTATTSTLAPFGELLIDSFKNMAQELVVSTNAENGYAVTAVSQNQLHRVGEACAGDADLTDGGCIQDTVGNSSNITHTAPGLWTLTSAKGFGYSLQENVITGSAVFEHSTNAGNCNGTSGGCWKQFADAEASEVPQTLFSSTTVADNDSVYVCYRGVIAPSQVAGTDYSTFVTYRATATF